MKRKFIEYKIRLDDKTEDCITEELHKNFDELCLTHPEYGIEQVGVLESGKLCAVGMIVMDTASECNAILKLLKASLKKVFVTNKLVDVMVAKGDCR